TALCSHLASVRLFTDSVLNQCPYVSYPCTSMDDFNAGKCSLDCDGRTRHCNRMGYWASPSDGNGTLYLKTQDASAFPYCIFRSGSVETRLIPLPMDIGTVTSIELSFSKTTNLLLQLFNSASWKFTQAVVLDGDSRNRRTFCPTRSVITSGSSTGFIVC
ncbi:unnamed protein product, partial [Rotaria magnacalcarata]